MFARRSLLLSSSQLATRRAALLSGAVALRVPATRPGMASSLQNPSAALTCARRQYLGATVLPNFMTHCTQIGACTSLSTLLYSPIGTAMIVILAYNVVVICSKHVNYSLEITAKDYVQDQQLLTIMRYGILSCILLGMEVMFIEV
ncbi:putative mitochondrial hypothetical protein [Leptomonas pyrrhocoris]|uniref:Uncharacterized protein n=1 Tax=Leptomonas pyrrhocoris TaxID=157538 RepID=A0A0N0VDU9_LEPPY|nr:putative mitochondrial hypothetical protein [Leptomonas pyrrhocoris]XP_015655083.1 putative mitochondrial hypothetical protein [Leptomonas pyrrhocoris]KPA76643.1 putative mitochondrial hypothetical protein [Leptomonas pyrrhocoris]KPA76644.1 putative mitochondrial hypothetical protein [Leptomonas pyrrhocoris]|eukprot:XP_015655082.1 putative mitochondrial hypothetical protein [Leptomonas pyrrhocoris]